MNKKIKKKLEEKTQLEWSLSKWIRSGKRITTNKDLLKEVLPLLREMYGEWCAKLTKIAKLPVIGKKDIKEFPDYLEELVKDEKTKD